MELLDYGPPSELTVVQYRRESYIIKKSCCIFEEAVGSPYNFVYCCSLQKAHPGETNRKRLSCTDLEFIQGGTKSF